MGADNVPLDGLPSPSPMEVAVNSRQMQERRNPLIAGRLVPRPCVTWSNHEHSGDGFKAVTAGMNIPRTEVECYFYNGEEVKPSAEDVIAHQASLQPI